jgi:hypothetical protein
MSIFYIKTEKTGNTIPNLKRYAVPFSGENEWMGINGKGGEKETGFSSDQGILSIASEEVSA